MADSEGHGRDGGSASWGGPLNPQTLGNESARGSGVDELLSGIGANADSGIVRVAGPAHGSSAQVTELGFEGAGLTTRGCAQRLIGRKWSSVRLLGGDARWQRTRSFERISRAVLWSILLFGLARAALVLRASNERAAAEPAPAFEGAAAAGYVGRDAASTASPSEPQDDSYSAVGRAIEALERRHPFERWSSPGADGASAVTEAARLAGHLMPGAPPPPPQSLPTRPPVRLVGVVGVGSRWDAILEGIPGRDGSVAARAGDTVGTIRVRRVTAAAVTLSGPTGTWRISLDSLP